MRSTTLSASLPAGAALFGGIRGSWGSDRRARAARDRRHAHLRSPPHPSGRQPDVQGRLLMAGPSPGEYAIGGSCLGEIAKKAIKRPPRRDGLLHRRYLVQCSRLLQHQHAVYDVNNAVRLINVGNFDDLAAALGVDEFDLDNQRRSELQIADALLAGIARKTLIISQ